VFEQRSVEVMSICVILVLQLPSAGAIICCATFHARQYIYDRSKPRNGSFPNPNVNSIKRGYQCIESNNRALSCSSFG